MRTISILWRTLAGFCIFALFLSMDTQSGLAQPPPSDGNSIFLPIIQQSVGGAPVGGAQILPNHTTYFDGYYRRHVVGEVENTSDRNLKSIQITVRFMSSSGEELSRNDNLTYLERLPAHEKTCFDVFVDEMDNWANYAVEISGYSTTPDLLPDLSITIDSAGPDVYYGFHIAGSVRNTETVTVSQIGLVGTLYNADHQVMDCDSIDSDQPTLNEGEQSTFNLLFQKRGFGSDYDQVSDLRVQGYGVRMPGY